MALNTLKYPLSRVSNLRGIQRSLSTQAAAAPGENQQNEVSCTTLSNRLIVASVDQCGALSRVSVCFRIGSRHETYKNLGIMHVIRSMAGFGTEHCTGFAIWKNTQQNGIHMYCTGDREITGFHIVGIRNNINFVLKYLAAVVSAPAFKRWEVKDNLPKLRYEVDCLTPQVKVIDNLHSVAFRKGLGNSLFVKPHRIGDHTPEMLDEFYKNGFSANRAVLSGFNIDHSELIGFGQSLQLPTTDVGCDTSSYYGGEVRCDVKSYFAHVAIGVQGVGVKDIKDSLAHSVLQYALGTRPNISWGGSPSPLYKAVYGAASSAGVSSFNFNYSDNGLFGVMISSYASEAGKALEAAFKVLKSGSISQEDFNRGKNMVKANVMMGIEKSVNLLDDISQQSLLGGVIVPAAVFVEALEKLSYSDVANIAKKMASKKFSLSAYGDLHDVPYLSDLQ